MHSTFLAEICSGLTGASLTPKSSEYYHFSFFGDSFFLLVSPIYEETGFFVVDRVALGIVSQNEIPVVQSSLRQVPQKPKNDAPLILPCGKEAFCFRSPGRRTSHP